MRLLAWRKRQSDIRAYGRGDRIRYLHAEEGRKWRSVLEAFDSIRDTLEGPGTPVLLVLLPARRDSWPEYGYHDLGSQVRSAAEARGFHVLDLYDDFAAYSLAELRVGPRDGHPSVLAHRIAARAIHRWMSHR